MTLLSEQLQANRRVPSPDVLAQSTKPEFLHKLCVPRNRSAVMEEIVDNFACLASFAGDSGGGSHYFGQGL
jgi:hypothetical protein